MELSMERLHAGQQGTVKRIVMEESLARRLADLGFAPGIGVYCCGCSPFNDLVAVTVGQRVLCLRRKDIAGVTLCCELTEDHQGILPRGR